MGLKDQSDLSLDNVFLGRVKAAMVAAAIAIANESVTTAFHPQRERLASQVMNSPGSLAPNFALAVATDATVAAAAGSPAVQGNVTDTPINNAVAAVWNSFFDRFQ